jgi:hypothetical protein
MTTVRFAAPLQSILIEEGYAPIGYLRIPPEAAEAIAAHEFERRLEMGKRRGFGSVKVTVTLGESRWQTSLFPNKDGSWFLPIKKPVRAAEGLVDGDEVEVELELF